MTRWGYRVLTVLLALYPATPALVFAEVDLTFGSGGVVLTDFGGRVDYLRTVMLQPDGKIIAVGYSGSQVDHGLALARYNQDGSLDVSFGTGGTVLSAFFGHPVGAVLQATKIVVAGWGGSGMGFQGGEVQLGRHSGYIVRRWWGGNRIFPWR